MAIEPKDSGRAISIHALREEGDSWRLNPKTAGERFLSTPSARRATSLSIAAQRRLHYFYPRPPRGGRHDLYAPFGPGEVFLSTPSARRATRWRRTEPGAGEISIHALREEGDD